MSEVKCLIFYFVFVAPAPLFDSARWASLVFLLSLLHNVFHTRLHINHIHEKLNDTQRNVFWSRCSRCSLDTRRIEYIQYTHTNTKAFMAFII